MKHPRSFRPAVLTLSALVLLSGLTGCATTSTCEPKTASCCAPVEKKCATSGMEGKCASDKKP